jgi:hypothetical protein
MEELAPFEESCCRGALKIHNRHRVMPPSGCAPIRPRRGVAPRKRKGRRREGLRKRKRRKEKEKKREGEESLRRWLKKRRAGAAPVRPQFLLMWLHGRLDLAKKALPAERLTKCSHCWTPSEQRGEKIG